MDVFPFLTLLFLVSYRFSLFSTESLETVQETMAFNFFFLILYCLAEFPIPDESSNNCFLNKITIN